MLAILIRKEMSVLSSGRAFWLLLCLSSVLVGHAFVDAIRFYAEASGSGGGPSALAQSLSPLDGLVVPVLGACDLTATFVFPFVVIGLFALEGETRELALTLQLPVPFASVVAAKTLALAAAWLLSLTPALVALTLWTFHGGHLGVSETLTVLLGYALRGVIGIGIGAAACAVASSAPSAAIIALTVTLGSWMLEYASAARGGLVSVLAAYTPESALRIFERGELRAATIAVLLILSFFGVACWGIASQTGQSRRARLAWQLVAGTLSLVLCAMASGWKTGADESEDRRNSFSREEEAFLRGLRQPLGVKVYLAAEDPRLTDLERGVLFKLRRVARGLHVEYASGSRSGMFETAGSHYGEIWYSLGDRSVMTRSVAEPVVLEALHELARVHVTDVERAGYPGYPARVESPAAPWLFFALIPLCLVFFWWVSTRVGLRQSYAFPVS